MASILFYSPFNQRSRDTESLMIAFHQQGHKVISLSQQEGYLIHDFLKANGIYVHSYVVAGERSGWWYYFRHLIFFVRFCWKNNVDIVYSHLEPANFVASVGQYLIRAKTYLCRHHIDEGALYNFNKDLYYRITYRLAKKIIVVSEHAKRYMVTKEKIPVNKILHINLAYDFNLYNKAVEKNVTEIRNQFKAQILLLTACRLTAFKRPEIAVHVVKKLSDLGLDVKLIMLGKGEMENQLKTLITDLGLSDKVSMPGYVSNVLDFMASSDFFLHPSLLDSSCVAVKEAGLVKLPVIVCKGVGDFDDYLIHEKNGFSVNRDTFAEEASEIIVQNFRNKDLLQKIGGNLNQSVLDLFSVQHVIGQYNSLNKIR